MADNNNGRADANKHEGTTGDDYGNGNNQGDQVARGLTEVEASYERITDENLSSNITINRGDVDIEANDDLADDVPVEHATPHTNVFPIILRTKFDKIRTTLSIHRPSYQNADHFIKMRTILSKCGLFCSKNQKINHIANHIVQCHGSNYKCPIRGCRRTEKMTKKNFFSHFNRCHFMQEARINKNYSECCNSSTSVENNDNPAQKLTTIIDDMLYDFIINNPATDKCYCVIL
uniref:C2H2-type domain-containing protein n=1 Tax=Strongyloides venezuelensis TaxID=75913 RepID=A0A0K0G3G5_STRVS